MSFWDIDPAFAFGSQPGSRRPLGKLAVRDVSRWCAILGRMKARAAAKFTCTSCGANHATWLGRCSACGEWNTIEVLRHFPAKSGLDALAPVVALNGVGVASGERMSSGSVEFDRALSGGIVRGSTILVGGEPGIGKSTLALATASAIASSGSSVLYVSAEESGEQVAARASRLGLNAPKLDFVRTSELASILAVFQQYSLVVIDSIQAIGDPELGGLGGSVSQVRHCAQALNEAAKSSATAAMILSHVTKDGALAGPKLLEHLVDAVFVIDGDRSSEARVIRCMKNRFGKVSEVGYLKMDSEGLTDESDPGAAQLEDRLAGAPGSVVTAARDGNRVRLVEIQALVVTNPREVPKRQFLGLSSQRCAVVIGLVEHFANIRLDKLDIFMSIAGGVNSDDPGLDLAIAAAIVSGALRIPLAEGVTLFGELGLTGELRKVRGDEERIEELRRHGFSSFVVPAKGAERSRASGEHNVRTLSEALGFIGLTREKSR